MRKYFLFAFLLFQAGLTYGQIVLDNASFEGDPEDATMPASWQPCAKGTTPDILPGPWNVRLKASEGNTYLGLITREDGTWESIGQRTSTTVKGGECYTFSLMLANSKKYAGYNKAIKLRIWGGQTACGKEVLLGESKYINHTDWKRYEFKFLPDVDINYIIFEAQHMDGIYFHYRGNILIDDCSTIDQCDRA
ncbi:MAG: hypothetical protein ACI8YQ_002562 [Polaribacter sp.]|jgi:hypothetical protein